ncbi:DNA mismatch repair protein MutL [Acrasis kona]|uniref:DNA mismatch repair protein MutL n=1 Tax=Acrasis kona TaxID=1008807 RepID=A0AAW2ZEL3_9EUKA
MRRPFGTTFSSSTLETAVLKCRMMNDRRRGVLNNTVEILTSQPKVNRDTRRDAKEGSFVYGTHVLFFENENPDFEIQSRQFNATKTKFSDMI